MAVNQDDELQRVWTATDTTGFRYTPPGTTEVHIWPDSIHNTFLAFADEALVTHATCGASYGLTIYQRQAQPVNIANVRCLGLAIGEYFVYVVPTTTPTTVEMRSHTNGLVVSGRGPIVVPGSPTIIDIAAVGSYLFMLAGTTVYKYDSADDSSVEAVVTMTNLAGARALVSNGDSVCVLDATTVAYCYGVRTNVVNAYSSAMLARPGFWLLCLFVFLFV